MLIFMFAAKTAREHDGESQITNVLQRNNRKKKQSHGTLVLGMLTISLVLCWGPNLVYFTLVSMGLVVDDALIETVTGNMIVLESIADPICFFIVHKDVRTALSNFVKSVTKK